MIAFLSGLLAGSLHVVSGPDHVAAVAPLALRTPRAGRILGALWGVGHGGGVLLWLGLAAAFQHVFGAALRSEALEALVGLALLALGVLAFLRSRPHARPHVHVHYHGPLPGHIPMVDGRAHVHLHMHSEGDEHGHDLVHDHRWHGNGTAFAMGALHGSAGASHLLALLPTLGLAGNAALTYAVGYLLAGVLAMASVGTLIGRYAGRLADPLRIQRFCALAVIALGLFWLFTSVRELA